MQRYTPLRQSKPLKPKKRLNRYSLKKIQEINEEAPIRIILARRAGGIPVIIPRTIYQDAHKFVLNRITCINGICEICHQRKPVLDPHEKTHRSQGGKLSLTNTTMVCRDCHNTEQKNYPMWGKREVT